MNAKEIADRIQKDMEVFTDASVVLLPSEARILLSALSDAEAERDRVAKINTDLCRDFNNLLLDNSQRSDRAEKAEAKYDDLLTIWAESRERHLKAEAELSRQSELLEEAKKALAKPETVTVPFMYGIREPDGSAYMDEICVDLSRQTLQELIEDREMEGYEVIPLYTTPPTPDAEAHERGINAVLATKIDRFDIPYYEALEREDVEAIVAAYQAAISAKEPTHDL